MTIGSGNSNGQTGSAAREARIADIYQRYAPQIAAYARRRTGPEEAADLVSETFLVAWRRSDDIPAEPDTLPWMYGVARYVLANQRRSTRRRGRLRDRLTSQFAEHHTPAHLAIEDRAEFDLLGRALNELSDDDAEVLRLVAWEGMSTVQVAAILGIEPDAARQRVHRARLRLRKKLETLTPVVRPAVLMSSAELPAPSEVRS